MESIEQIFKNLKRKTKQSICEKVVNEFNEFFEFNIKDYRIDNFYHFVEDLKTITRDHFKPYGPNSLKICEFLKKIKEAEKTKTYKNILKMAESAETEEDYNIIFEAAAEFGNKLVKKRFAPFKKLARELEEDVSSLIISERKFYEIVEYTHLLSYNKQLNKKAAKSPYCYKKNGHIPLADIIKHLEKGAKEEILEEASVKFREDNNLALDEFNLLVDGSFDYSLKLKNDCHFEEAFSIYIPPNDTIEDFIKNLTEIYLIEEKEIKRKLSYENKITAYAIRTKKLDRILNELTKEFCATKCKKNIIKKYGCCENNYSNRVPDLKELQEKEAVKNGWA